MFVVIAGGWKLILTASRVSFFFPLRYEGLLLLGLFYFGSISTQTGQARLLSFGWLYPSFLSLACGVPSSRCDGLEQEHYCFGGPAKQQQH